MFAPLLLLPTLFFAAGARAQPATVGPVVISVPDGFQPAQTQRLKKTLISAWTKSVRNGTVKTLLQVNVVDFGVTHPQMSESQLTARADRYLQEFLVTTGRRRAEFTASAISHLQLAGSPASRATWNGSIGGRDITGVMYSVIIKDRYCVILHTQDLGNAPTPGMYEALGAIESLRLAGESGSAPPVPDPLSTGQR